MRERLQPCARRCPGAGCARAVALVSDAAPPEVFCECGAYYCARCSHAPHWPATCEQRRKWEETLHSSPDVQYLRQHTRPCPSCDVRTQRTEGCMHITCSNCGVEWCWACGMSGRGVHHAFACSKQPVPTWKYQQEQRRLEPWLQHRVSGLQPYCPGCNTGSPGCNPTVSGRSPHLPRLSLRN